MRLAFLFLLAFIPAVFADTPVVIKDSEAANHIGETVEVRGMVSSVHTSRKDNSFLNMGGVYPNQAFTGFIKAGPTFRSMRLLSNRCRGKKSASWAP